MLVQMLCLITALAGVSKGEFPLTFAEPLKCGNWAPYKDEKCIKIASNAGYKNQEDAELVCQSYSESLNHESYPKLITIKTKEEQEFLEHYLFTENKVVSNVWLGLKEVGTTGRFEWNDGSEQFFSNWYDQNVTDSHHNCVEMESGRSVNPLGVWSKVDCKKESIVVCERTQAWNLETLQTAFLNNKMEQELQKIEWKKEINSLKESNHIAQEKIAGLEQNPVPIGFIYVQLPNQTAPTTLWPATKWTEVSAYYAGIFFRVEGGTAAPFGEVQSESTRSLVEVKNVQSNAPDMIDLPIPQNGNWSGTIYSGHDTGDPRIHLQFRVSSEEVHPRNQAVKIWQRIQ